MADIYGIESKTLLRGYKDHLSNYHSWNQLSHADEYLIFAKNIGERLCIDETCLSIGELYTIITNKAAKGKNGAIVAIIKGVKSDDIIRVLEEISSKLRKKVKEVTVDMAANFHKVIRRCFRHAEIVIDRFHVQQLANDALQDIRIKHRWEAIDKENKDKKEKTGRYSREIFSNGESRKQLLVRAKWALSQSRDKWNEEQKERIRVLFNLYPDLKEGYELVDEMRQIMNLKIEKTLARTKLAAWYNKMEEFDNKAFTTVAETYKSHHDIILNYFNNRSTNACAESFNAKIKAFRADFRGVRDVKFFLYRLCKIYA